MSQQNDAKVLEIAQALIQADPQNYVHPLNAAQALIRMQRGQEALTYLQQALAPGRPMTRTAGIGQLAQQFGDTQLESHGCRLMADGSSLTDHRTTHSVNA